MSTRRPNERIGTPSSAGETKASPQLTDTLYDQLHRIAMAKFRGERSGHTLQPTALVNEAYMCLAKCDRSLWEDRARILGVAAHMMRNILVDYARAHRAGKRGGGAIQVTLDSGLIQSSDSPVDVLAVDEALTRLAEFDERQAAVLEMHFFADLTFDEIARQLGVATRTVKRDSAMARAWLHDQLAPRK